MGDTSAKIMAQIKKDFGAGVVDKAGKEWENLPRLPTGVFPLDLSMGGGFPMGKCSEIFGIESSGKTNLAYLTIAQGQLIYPDKQAVFVDAEHGFDPMWARALGVDTDRLILVHPEYAEQAADIIESFLYATDVFLIVLDSIAALTTQNESDSSTEKAAVGGASALIGKMYRKITVAYQKLGNAGSVPPAFIGINQTRTKIGCFDYTSPVWLADGSVMRIGKIVNQKLGVEVLSKNPDGLLVPRKVVGWANNGDGYADEWIRLTIAGGNSGRRVLKVTKGHTIFTPEGERLAGDLSVGDLVTTEGTRFYTDEQHEVILGSIFGDGSLRFEKGSTRGHLRVGHGPKQREYAEYKASVLGCSVNNSKNPSFETRRSLEFGRYSGISKKKGLLHVPQEYVKQLTLRALAIWYLDDGTYGGSPQVWGWGRPSISTKTIDLDSLARFAKKIRSIGAGMPTVKVGRGLVWGKGNACEFFRAIAPYVPPCMEYKIKAGLKTGGLLAVEKMEPRLEVYSEPVVEIKEGTGTRTKYDITVEGEHNYLVGGVVVHNTMFGDPTTTPGGNAPKFAASMRIRTYGKNIVEKSISAAMPAYKEMNCTLMKWKAPILAINSTFKMAMLPIGNNPPGYVDSWSTLCAYMKELDYLSKGDKGGWLMLGENYKTLEEAKAYLYADPGMLQQVQNTIISEMLARGSTPSAEEAKEPEDVGEV